MSEVDEETRKKRIKKLTDIFARTKENGFTEEESATAMEMGSRLMQDWAIEDYELGFVSEKKSFVKQQVMTKYANKWRWETANTIAHNIGVLAIHYGGKNETMFFYGREQPVMAGCMIAEYVIGAIEDLSADFAKRTGTGLTGKRKFARGCAMRMRDRIRRSYDLTADPRLPTIMKEARDEAKENYGDLRDKRSVNKEDHSPEFLAGWVRGEFIPLNKERQKLR